MLECKCVILEYREELEDFQVILKHEHRRGKTHVSFVRQVTILVYGQRIELLKKAKVRVIVNCLHGLDKKTQFPRPNRILAKSRICH